MSNVKANIIEVNRLINVNLPLYNCIQKYVSQSQIRLCLWCLKINLYDTNELDCVAYYNL